MRPQQGRKLRLCRGSDLTAFAELTSGKERTRRGLSDSRAASWSPSPGCLSESAGCWGFVCGIGEGPAVPGHLPVLSHSLSSCQSLLNLETTEHSHREPLQQGSGYGDDGGAQKPSKRLQRSSEAGSDRKPVPPLSWEGRERRSCYRSRGHPGKQEAQWTVPRELEPRRRPSPCWGCSPERKAKGRITQVSPLPRFWPPIGHWEVS